MARGRPPKTDSAAPGLEPGAGDTNQDEVTAEAPAVEAPVTDTPEEGVQQAEPSTKGAEDSKEQEAAPAVEAPVKQEPSGFAYIIKNQTPADRTFPELGLEQVVGAFSEVAVQIPNAVALATVKQNLQYHAELEGWEGERGVFLVEGS